jgi:hypothetical protein
MERCVILLFQLVKPQFVLTNVLTNVLTIKTKTLVNKILTRVSKWSQLGSNQRPPDYESGALTN